ncbi:MAG: hypothetical protein NC048_07045 [Bacteroides sp.]|nr:hypothetical protein [Ruminococcus flavefaciens]MCM1555237.1 hypothetical protein [Bacteroides sp.]
MVTKNTTVSGYSVSVRDVTVKTGAKLTIDAKGTVTFGTNFTVEEGAELEVKKP